MNRLNRRDALLTAALAPLFGSYLRPAFASNVAAAATATEAKSALDTAPIWAAQQRLSRRLVQALAKNGGTVVVSPASIAGAFSALSAGASPELVNAIARLLGFDETAAPQALVALAQALGQSQESGGALSMARALVLDPALKPSAETLAGLRAADVERIDAAFDDPRTLERVNHWVAAKTKGLIPVLLDELPDQPGLVGLDALHFKDHWKHQFDAKETVAKPFHLTNGAKQTVQMMMSPDASWRFRMNEEFVGATLAYRTDRFSLTLVTSRAKPLAASGLEPVESWLSGMGFKDLQGQIQLPKLKLSGSNDLLSVLDPMGLAPARLQPNALAGFSAGILAISKIMQRVELRIDEEGTEAAAATGIVASRSMTSDYVQMVVDKPFMFSLADAKTGLVLLAGYVGDIPQGS